MRWIYVLVAAAVLTWAPGVAAQSAKPGAFNSLSPSNQRIAEALYRSQRAGAARGSAWSLDQIASASQSEFGWGGVFKQMQTTGLIRERNLGEVVSQYRSDARPGGRELTVVTTQGGRSFVEADPSANRGPARLDGRSFAKNDPSAGRGIAVVRGRYDAKGDGSMPPGSAPPSFVEGDRGVLNANWRGAPTRAPLRRFRRLSSVGPAFRRHCRKPL
jgi:hypothetical protein